MGQPFVVVDAFTDRPFAGNPACVCVLERAADEAWMAAVACEMNLSETAFLYPESEGYRLRWFTPTVEVDLCGHATLASAHVLWASGRLRSDESARFHTRSGLLTAAREGAAIVLDFPAADAVACAAPAGLSDALGAPLRESFCSGPNYLVRVDSERSVRELSPDFHALSALSLRTVIVTATAETAGVDFVSRFFAPAVGVPEDPVTGSAHCMLGPFWGARLGKRELSARQLSRRGGSLRVALRGRRVALTGQAVSVSSGEILGPPAASIGSSEDALD